MISSETANNFIRYNKIALAVGFFITAFFLPIKTSLSNVGLILIVTSSFLSILSTGLSIDKNILKSPFILFVPLIIGVIYTKNIDETIHQWFKYLFLLTTPLLLLRKRSETTNLLKITAYGLVIGSLLSAIYLVGHNVYNFFLSGFSIKYLFSYYFTSDNFTAPLKDMHPIYLGSYYLFGVVLVFKAKNISIPFFLKTLFSGILFIAILFCNSRVIFLAAFICILSAPFVLKTSLKRKLLFVGAVLFMILIFIFFFKNTYVYNKIVKVTAWELTENIGTANIAPDAPGDSRMARWIVGWEAFKERPLFGYGTGMESETLMEKYRTNNMQVSLERGYNAHNQYLGYLIRFGLLGGLFIFGYVLLNSYLSFKQRDMVYFSYILIVGVVFLVENYIDRNMGINFVALFGTLLCLNDKGTFKK
mgnify:FL=1